MIAERLEQVRKNLLNIAASLRRRPMTTEKKSFVPSYTYIKSKEEYLALRDAWRQNWNGVTAVQMLVFSLLRDKPADRGFSPVTSKKKLANGARPNYTYRHTLGELLGIGFILADFKKNSKAFRYHDQKLYADILKEFLTPFGPYVTVDVLEAIVKQAYTLWNKP